MKRKALVFLTAGLMGMSGVSAEVVAGWEAWKWSGAPMDPMVSLASVQKGVLAKAIQSGPWNIMEKSGSSDGTFGSYSGVVADQTIEVPGDGYALGNGTNGSIDFIITNTSGSSIELAHFYFDALRLRNGSAEHWSVEILSGGNISSGVIGRGELVVYSIDNNMTDLDLDLSALEDTVLDENETVVFRLSFSGGNGDSGQHTYVDNVALTTKSPPASLGLLIAVR